MPDRYRSCEYELGHGPWDPVSGGVLAISGLFYNVFRGFGEIGSDLARLSRVLEASDGARSKDAVIYSAYSPKKSAMPLSVTDGKTLGSGSLKGVGRIVKTTLRSPMAFSWALAQGAHNAPRMWGDKTVRPQDKITGLRSGLVAAGEVGFSVLRRRFLERCLVLSASGGTVLRFPFAPSDSWSHLLILTGTVPRHVRWSHGAVHPALPWRS